MGDSSGIKHRRRHKEDVNWDEYGRLEDRAGIDAGENMCPQDSNEKKRKGQQQRDAQMQSTVYRHISLSMAHGAIS